VRREIRWIWGHWTNSMICMSFCPAPISMYIEQTSHRLGWMSTMPSNNVFSAYVRLVCILVGQTWRWS
ncbi:hypothetical protein BJY52DRAFT_1301916, partial [Lactarius psammicola]